jgi:hypothetical protein
MRKLTNRKLNIRIDKLTNSIENAYSKDSFPTEVSQLKRADLFIVLKKNGWKFNWKNELQNPEREVYKLTICNNPDIIQGVISLEIKHDHVYVHLIESAPFNIGRKKAYLGVPGNLFAFACKLSFQRGNSGYVAFMSKTKLIEHYIQNLNAIHFGGHLMIIITEGALKLTNKYFND